MLNNNLELETKSYLKSFAEYATSCTDAHPCPLNLIRRLAIRALRDFEKLNDYMCVENSNPAGFDYQNEIRLIEELIADIDFKINKGYTSL